MFRQLRHGQIALILHIAGGQIERHVARYLPVELGDIVQQCVDRRNGDAEIAIGFVAQILNLLRHLIDLVGAEKIALGSDYPFPLGEDVPGKLIEHMPYSDPTKEWLLYRSAEAWLGIKAGSKS